MLASWLQFAHSQPAADRIQLGRQVYIAEGCVHCHSQYIRPADASLAWGEPRDPDFSRTQIPALIGNRRQGPDLMNVGRRRTDEWQQMHLCDPRSVVPTSRMPSYAHLFASGDARGPALLSYLGSLGRETNPRLTPGGPSDIAIADRHAAQQPTTRSER